MAVESSAQLRVTHLAALPSPQGRFGIQVVLELLPIAAGIDQKEGVVFQQLTSKAAFRLDAETPSPSPLQQLLPGLGRRKHQAEIAGVDPRLLRFQAVGKQKLGHQLMASQREDQGLPAATPGDAAQALHISALGCIEIPAGNGEMKAHQLHKPSHRLRPP